MNARSPILTLSFIFCLGVLAKGQNLTIYRSDTSVVVTTERIVSLVKETGLIFFETVDHQSIAKDRGVLIPPTNSILFEDAELTSKLITCQQTTALDLPMEILVWEENGDVYIGFIDPKFMKKRFLVIGCDDILEEMSRIMIKISNDTLRD